VCVCVCVCACVCVCVRGVVGCLRWMCVPVTPVRHSTTTQPNSTPPNSPFAAASNMKTGAMRMPCTAAPSTDTPACPSTTDPHSCTHACSACVSKYCTTSRSIRDPSLTSRGREVRARSALGCGCVRCSSGMRGGRVRSAAQPADASIHPSNQPPYRHSPRIPSHTFGAVSKGQPVFHY